jgi:glycosyltransferase involved in cell wall biosynthesis
MKASVAMCTYNGAKFLQKQLESIANQTIKPSELIVCDDGSTDQTLAILEEFALVTQFPVAIHQNATQLGVVKNFEKAISLCTGDLIFLADQDDIWMPEKIETMSFFFSTNPKCLLLFTDALLIDEVGKSLSPHSLWTQINFNQKIQSKLSQTRYALWTYLKGNNFATGATLAFRRPLLSEALPFPKIEKNDWYHDWWLSLNAACKKGLFYSSRQLTQYRIHQMQQVGIGQQGSIANQTLFLANYKYNFARYYSFQILNRLKLNLIEKCLYTLGLLANLLLRYNALQSQKKMRHKHPDVRNQL